MSTAQTAKEKNFKFFEKELSRLLGDLAYKNKFVVIHGEAIKGTYDSFESALSFAVANFPAEEFVIQRVIGQSEQIDFLRAAIP
jgi:hypothetical protein